MTGCLVVADAGSTKIDWTLANREGVKISFTTPGVNAVLGTVADFEAAFQIVKAQMGSAFPDRKFNDNNHIKIFFYGAGCTSDAINQKVSEGARRVFGHCFDIDIKSDLVGAAVALFASEKGIACILGTGSNTGFYDGRLIARQVPSLGFILGDEGSGCALGKRLLNRYFKGPIPVEVKEMLEDEFDLVVTDVIEKVYRAEKPNTYLASFVPFIAAHRENAWMKELIFAEIDNLYNRNLVNYPELKNIPLGFCGSIASVFSNEIGEYLLTRGISDFKIIQNPITALTRFHLQNAFRIHEKLL